MKNILKVSRKFIVLAIMLFALGVLTFTDFGAAPSGASQLCCSDCDPNHNSCILGGGRWAQCEREARYCWQYCDIYC